MLVFKKSEVELGKLAAGSTRLPPLSSLSSGRRSEYSISVGSAL